MNTLVQYRFLICIPGPQVREHWDHSPQEPHNPTNPVKHTSILHSRISIVFP